MDDKRHIARTRALKGAKIVFGGGTQVIDCTIRNRSVEGAQLKVASVVGIPDHFDLLDTTTGERKAATVAWRKPAAMGVVFD